MAQLKHVLESILKAVLEARISADVSAGEASRAYDENTGLKHFPVPRVDVSSVEIDLKFTVDALKDAVQDHPQTDSTPGTNERNQVLDRNFEKFSAAIAGDAIMVFARMALQAILRELKKDEKKKARLNGQWKNLKKRLGTRRFREMLIYRILKFFRAKQTDLVTADFKFDLKTASDPLIKLIEDALFQEPDVALVRGIIDEDAIKNAIKNEVLRKLGELRDQIEMIGSSGKAFDLVVNVAAEDLQDIEKEKVSSIKMRAVLKNYVWRRVEELDGKVSRQLIPE
jgi:hypothetical protein